MPRRRRGWLNDTCYHITHRCHEREFYFKFAKQRDRYRLLMYESAKQYKVKILDYIVTSNHVHLLIKSRNGDEISDFLRVLHGRAAQSFNNSKGREGGFWSDRFHSTRIQSGAHLGQCLFYIDLNMVRAGVVKHPEEWEHGSYSEFAGTRKRYRVIDMDELLISLNIADLAEFKEWYLNTLEEKLKSINVREPYWSEAVAVGEEDYLKTAANQAMMKRYTIKEAKPGTTYLVGKYHFS